MNRTVAVPVEVYRGRVTDLTREALVAARSICGPEGEVVAYAFGEVPPESSQTLQLADRIVYLRDTQVNKPVPLAQAGILKNRLSATNVDVVLIGSSSWGLDLAPMLASYMGAPLVANCHSLDDRDGVLWATCRICAGKLLVDVEITTKPAVILLLPGNYLRREVSPGLALGETHQVAPEEWDNRVAFHGFIEPKAEDVDITQVEILVAVGRGIERQENLELAEELAEVLGGVVCGSRPVVDQGWLPPTRQVGKSGMIVKPKLYLALGISGAPEHVEGMKDAELIVAINRDEQAPIFNVAHYGIAADLFDVVPALKEALVSRRQEV